jgi:hypothetical protein
VNQSINNTENGNKTNSKPQLDNCLSIVWSKSIRYEFVERNIHNINISEFNLDAASRSIQESLMRIAYYCFNEIVYDTQIKLISVNTAELATNFFIPDNDERNHIIKGTSDLLTIFCFI